jgi:hypothetical protein
VPGQEAPDAADARVLAGDVLEGQVGVERGRVELPGDAGEEEERLELGREREPTVRQREEVERLLPDAVAREDEPLAGAVPDGDREHPLERRREVRAVLLVHVRNHRRVARARDVVPEGLEVAPHVLEVVELAVEDRDDVSGLVRCGLVARDEVDDAQAPVAEDAASEARDAARVGPPVEERLGHPRDDLRVGRSGGRY